MASDNREPAKKPVKQSPKKTISRSPGNTSDADGVIFYNNAKDLSARKQPLPQRVPKEKRALIAAENEKKKKAEARKAKIQKKSSLGKLSGKRVVLNTVVCILAAAVIVAGAFNLTKYTFYSRIGYNSNHTAADQEKAGSRSSGSNNGGSKSSGSQNVKPYSGDLIEDKDILNIVLIGADTRKDQDTGNSDTIVLFSIDSKHKKLKMLSFLRDTYVEVPGYGENRINASFALGGASLVKSTIELNYGIMVDKYAVVDFKSFRSIIDTLGGIDIALTEEEIDYINWQCWTNNQVDTRYELNASDYFFYNNSNGDKVAKVHLNGRQALWHARNRGQEGICSGDDFTRTQRQRNVISIVINRLKKSSLQQIISVLYEIGPMITTNMKASEIDSLSGNALKYLSYSIVSDSAPHRSELGETYTFSDEYNPVYIDGALASVILINDWISFRESVSDFIYED